MLPWIDGVFVGGPATLTDAQGEWRSSIGRIRQSGPVVIGTAGILGDQVTQRYHGGPNAALCVHLTEHYRFWLQRYEIALTPGAFGENLTVGGLLEEDVCVADVVRCGSATVQVSGPRVPCANLARRIGRVDFVRLTVRENRTGFYLRVLEPGTVAANDEWQMLERRNEDASISRINRCMYLDFDPTFAHRMLNMPGLAEWWSTQAAQKLYDREAHWSLGLKD